jgi:hypothetical protein
VTSEHIKRKHAFAAISDRDEYRRLLDRCALTADDARLMELLYVKRIDLACAADMVGYSYTTAYRRHKKALAAISELTKKRFKDI